MRNILIFSIGFFFCVKGSGQSVDLSGKVIASGDVDGIHIINKTASRFTISSADGTFIITAKLKDTILFSAISYQPKEIVITKFIMASKQLPVYLDELITALDEVLVGTILTGDLYSDITNAKLKPKLDFYDLGIPGYTGKLMSQSERRLYEATSGGGLVPIGLIVNAITGRTKRLKEHIKLEKSDDCLDKIISEFSEDLFSNSILEEDHKLEFFYYCQDDPKFDNLCKNKNPMATFEFLKMKMESYKSILKNN